MLRTPIPGPLAGILALAAAAACDSGTVVEPPTDRPVTATEWINSVDWNQRTVITVTMTETSPGGPLAFAPANITLEAGKPYVLRLLNPGGNVEKHYFSPDALPDFYRAIAMRKIETPDAEYKAPYFYEIEMGFKAGGAQADLYFVPVLPGTYKVYCRIGGHRERGMVGQITITGGDGNQLNQEVAQDFDPALATDARQSSSHAVWQARVDETVQIVETPSYTFVPRDLGLRQGVAYKITLRSVSGNVEKHYYTASGFFKSVVWRKAEDSHAEIKAPYLREVELLVGGTTTLWVVPTRIGVFETRCTITGHVEKGMIGSVVVTN